jgi:hypothetical protein
MEPTKPSPARKIGGVLVALVALFAIFYACTSALGRDTSTAADLDRQRMEAIAGCEALVEDQLRSPSTAEYDSTARQSGGAWSVSGAVDSENALSGTVRTDYECTVTVSTGEVRTVLESIESR